MKKIITNVILLLILLPFISVSQIYVSPTGVSTNAGTLASPTTLEKAITTVLAGQTIYMRGGTYNFAATILITETNNGTSSGLKRVEAYSGEVPVLDFSAQALLTSNRGIILDGDYWYFKNIIVQNAGDNGVLLSGNNNTFENCIFRKNRDSGLQMSRYNTAYNSISQWPSNNLILNCEAFDNKDATAENADGFAAKLTCGSGNVFRGCIAHNNSDDGWDFYAKSETGPIGIVTLEGCVAYNNGTLTDGSTSSNGDKNGFKLGGSGIAVNHIVRRCVAFGNGQHGFTDNNNPGNIELTNNTSWNNAQSNFNFRTGSTSTKRNNLSFNAGQSDKTSGTDIGNTNVWWKNGVSTNSGSLVVSSADFVSLTPPSSIKNADGSPNLGNLLALSTGSDMINAGVTSTGIIYSGSAPDIGARESGATTTTTYSLTTTASPTAGGTITRSPNATSYAAGTVVTLTATPASGYTFGSWGGSASGTAMTTTVTINANTTVTANFSVIPTNTTYSLTTTASPTAGGTITRSPNATSYAAGTVVTLTATPASGYTFGSWGGSASGTTTTTTVTISANTTVTANFSVIPPTTYTLTTTASPTMGGTITRSPNAIGYISGAVVTLTATPASGYTFGSWGGSASGTTTTTTVTISANTTVTANFSVIPTTTSTTLRIEDATSTTSGLCSFDGSREKNYAGADNSYYINLSNSSGKGITYKVNATVSGVYSIKFRYANAGSNSTTPGAIFVNGVSVIANLPFTKTSTWTAWTTTTPANITLTAGVNTIRMEAVNAKEFANIDWFEITGNNPTAASCAVATRISSELNIEKSLSEQPNNLNISVNPNPTVSVLNLKVYSPKSGSASIYLNDITGREILSIDKNLETNDNFISIDCSKLNKGMYLISVIKDAEMKALKVLIE